MSDWITDSYVEWAPNSTEDFTNNWYGDGLLDSDGNMYVSYDANQTPTTIYPPPPKKVRPPSPPVPPRPPSAPYVAPPAPPRIRRPKAPPLPYNTGS